MSGWSSQASTQHLMLKGLLLAVARGTLALHSASTTMGTFPSKIQGAVPRENRTLGFVGEADVQKDSS